MVKPLLRLRCLALCECAFRFGKPRWLDEEEEEDRLATTGLDCVPQDRLVRLG